MEAPPALRDQDAAAYVASLGLPGIVDLHVHFMPERVQAKVWPTSTGSTRPGRSCTGPVLWHNGARLLGLDADPDG